MEKNLNKINLRDIDIDLILTSASFQKKLNMEVQIIIINMGEEKYQEAVKLNGSEENFLEKIKKFVLNKIFKKISNKLFWGSSAAITGLLLSQIDISTFEGDAINLDNIDWSNVDWNNLDWETIDFNNSSLDVSDISNDILGDGLSNFLVWAKDATFEWLDDSDYC